MKAFKAKIYGKVQGVGFRASTQFKAKKLGLKGWIRNEKDGTVECFCEGSENEIEQIKSWLKNGSPGHVEKVHFKETPVQNFDSFEIRY